MVGTHIQFLKRPSVEPDLYYDRKQNWSLNVLAVCDDKKVIVNYYVGAYGSCHDKRVFRCSGLPEELASLPPGLVLLGKCSFKYNTKLLSHAVDIRHALRFSEH